MQLIEHTFLPFRLLLTWQAPEGKERRRFAVGELREAQGGLSFRYLTESEDFRKAQELGFNCYPAFRKTNQVYFHGVREAFLRRVPPRSRKDFPKFLQQWRLRADSELPDFTLLAYCGAKLPSDGFSLVWPLEEVTPPGEVLLEVAGFRYQDIRLEELSAGMPVRFTLEPSNPKDPNALRMDVDGRPIGYVNRFQRNAVANWLGRHQIDAWVERFNGTSERPLVYVYCRVSEQSSAQLPRAATC
ncbi:HIRAN domain-containing protein [Thiohalomonas denitrificans]|uniref:HIRAN domain-containing protein n=1 Tax=Thiohalomonas denitrificans TaxID=415747 RepID=UPI0026EC4E33|nr:HIRAN domain-containing protein [Thiohalomonas denitrificans]